MKPASPEKLFIQFVAAVVIQERGLNPITQAIRISQAARKGKTWTRWPSCSMVTQSPGRRRLRSGTERFHISEAQTTAILIPAGTRVTDASGTLTWETVACLCTIGETYADVQIRCQTVGAVGNGYAAGQINTFVDLFDYCERCENLTASDDGADKATDDEFYELMRASQDAYSCAGAKGGYIYFAKQVSTKIADVVANSPSDGTVDLYVLMDDGTIATTEIKNAVLAACNDDTVRPLTDKVSVKDPQKVNYNITFTYYVPKDSSLSSTEIKAAVDKAAAEFVAWQCGKLGRDINPSVLIGKLMQTGIKRVALTSRSLPRCGMDPTTRRRRLRRLDHHGHEWGLRG